MKVGILGGTFNPIHNGHLKIAVTALKRLKLDHVLFIPSYLPPHRLIKGLTPARHRFEMVRLATQKKKRFLPSPVELERKGKSYSVETLRILRRLYQKGTRFFFIIGSDSLPELYSWRKIGELSRLCEFVSVLRDGHPLEGLDARKLKLPPRIFRRVTQHRLKIKPAPVSGTQIRARLRAGKSVKGLVPEKVSEYIRTMKLYRKK